MERTKRIMRGILNQFAQAVTFAVHLILLLDRDLIRITTVIDTNGEMRSDRGTELKRTLLNWAGSMNVTQMTQAA